MPADEPGRNPGWLPPVEPDPFWGPRAASRIPAWREGVFFAGRPRPAGHPSFLAWASRRPLGFGAVLAGLGIWGVFAAQLYPFVLLLSDYSFFLQLVIGAPVFEEFLKLGVALAVAGALPARGPERGVVLGIRLAVAWVAGALFGLAEHTFVYQDQESFWWRILFHSGTAALSMATFGALENLPDRRARWGATVPSSVLHYANNAFVIPISLALGGGAAEVWASGVTVAVHVALAVVLVAPRQVAGVGRRQAARRLPPEREAVQAP